MVESPMRGTRVYIEVQSLWSALATRPSLKRRITLRMEKTLALLHSRSFCSGVAEADDPLNHVSKMLSKS